MVNPTPVQPMDSSKENSPVAGPIEDETTVVLSTAKRTCVWNGETYVEGAYVNDGSRTYECHLGQWVGLD